MKRKAKWLGLALVPLAAALAAQGPSPQANRPEIRDKTGDTQVYGWTRVRYENAGEGRMKFIVRPAEGKRIIGIWKKQDMRVEVGALDAVMNTGKDGAYRLLTATMSGSIDANFTRPSSNAASKERQVVDIKAGSAEYTATEQKVDVKGGVTLVRRDPGAQESMNASGASGVITLSEQGASTNAVKTAVLTGPVDMTMTGRRQGDDGKPQAYTLKGHANRMVFSDASRTIVFTGNVRISGDDPGLGGEISGVHTATVTLSKTGEIESIDLEGDPGRTVITDKKGGGRR